MPRPFSEDLRWRAIWMKEMLRHQVDEVVAALNLGQVKANTIGILINGVATYPRVEFLIMEAVLKYPEKTLSEVASDVYTASF